MKHDHRHGYYYYYYYYSLLLLFFLVRPTLTKEITMGVWAQPYIGIRKSYLSLNESPFKWVLKRMTDVRK